MRCYHKSAGAVFTVLAMYTNKNKKCNTHVSKSGSECASVNLNLKKITGKCVCVWGGGGGGGAVSPGPPRYAGAFGPIP